MKEATHARVMAPVFIAFAVLVALFAGLVNADVAKAYDLAYEEGLARCWIDLSSRTEPIPLYKGESYFAVSQNAGTIKGLKISNKSVAGVCKEDSKVISIWAKKTGTATISYKQKGKTKKFKIKVINYTSPVKTLKVGKRDYASDFKKKSWGYYTLEEAAGKIQVKAAPGWQVSKIIVNGKSVKNGYKIKRFEGCDTTIVFKKNGSSQIRVLVGTPPYP